MKYNQDDFDPTQVRLEDYGKMDRKLVISPAKTKGVIEAGTVKGYPLDRYFVTISVGIFPPRPGMEMKGFYSIKMIPKATDNPLATDEGKWTQLIKVRPENLLGVMAYSVSTYLVMREMQGFSVDKMMEELAASFESGKDGADMLRNDYKRLVR